MRSGFRKPVREIAKPLFKVFAMNPPHLFCSNPSCTSRGLVGAGNILRAGYAHGRQRYECKVCGHSFTQTQGTPLYRLKTDPKTYRQIMTLLAWGTCIQAIVAAFDMDERTLYAWLRAAGAHCQRVHENLVLGQPRVLEQVQADEIRVKVQKRQVAWMALAICVPTRLWLGGVVRTSRDKALITTLAVQVKACALFGHLLLVADGLAAYVSAWKQAFRTPIWTGRPGRPRLLEWPVLIGQVIKQKENGRVVGVLQRMVEGSIEQSKALGLLVSAQLNTAFIERLNGTFRARLASLVRRSRALARQVETLTAGMYLVGTVYNFCTFHKSLRQEQPQGQRKWRERTPAMAAGITDHAWTVEELLSYRVPPPPYVPPRRQGRPPRTAVPPALAGCPT